MDKLKLKIKYKFIDLENAEKFEVSQKAIEAKIRVLDFLIKRIILKAD
ncbi:MAG: hypothetical protein JWM44_741 [Bacilli bacterium]|nr:hypothetical protein [Bacilli bacterium]